MKTTELLIVVETALRAYTRNNPLTFLSSLADQGYQIVPIDSDAVAEAMQAENRMLRQTIEALENGRPNSPSTPRSAYPTPEHQE